MISTLLWQAKDAAAAVNGVALAGTDPHGLQAVDLVRWAHISRSRVSPRLGMRLRSQCQSRRDRPTRQQLSCLIGDHARVTRLLPPAVVYILRYVGQLPAE